MKRQRGRGRRPGGGHHNHGGGGGGHQNPNRALESNGPDTKVRGPAAHIYERYLQLARDAQSSGDRVLSENYLQHADHYFRLVRSMQPATPVQQPQQNFSEDAEFEGDDGEGAEEGEARAEGDDQQPTPESAAQDDARDDRGEGEGGGRRRGRNRRRFRSEGERGSFEAGEGDNGREPGEGERREPRRERVEGDAPRESRRERQPREDRESGGREGFSDGPKPAFLRGGGGE